MVSSTAFALLIGCITSNAQQIDSELNRAGTELLSVVETGDPDQLGKYLTTQTDIVDQFGPSDDVYRFFFDGNWVRQYIQNGKSIYELVSEGDINIEVAPQPDGTLILIFIPGIYFDESGELEFEFEEWMRKYFACRFAKTEGRWQLSSNYCFAETGGPFPIDDGI